MTTTKTIKPRPRILDLFCGAGGAAMGYHRAGFDVIGVDIVEQPDFPFEFIQADALRFLADMRDDPWIEFDAVHASPPCQSYSAMSNRWGSKHPELIGQVRDLMPKWTPYVIENVDGARRDMREPIVRLTGEMFGLRVHRPRLFELGGWFAVQPPPRPRQSDAVAVYGKPNGRLLRTRSDGTELRAWSSIEEGQEALGIDWTDDWHQLREAIPPAYTEWIGIQLLAYLEEVPDKVEVGS